MRWLLKDAGWRRPDPWTTSTVDLDPAGTGTILGLAPGHSPGACIEGWLAQQDAAFRDAVEVVAIDPSAPYAAGLRRAPPAARTVVDHWRSRPLDASMFVKAAVGAVVGVVAGGRVAAWMRR